MAFTWTAPKGQGLYILKEVLTEMRDNADYIDDNFPSCLYHNGTYYNAEYVDDRTSEYSADCSAALVYDYNSNYSPRCIGQYGAAP